MTKSTMKRGEMGKGGGEQRQGITKPFTQLNETAKSYYGPVG